MPAATTIRPSQNDQSLWLLSFVIAILMTFGMMLGIGFMVLQTESSSHSPSLIRTALERVVVIVAPPELTTPIPAIEPATPPITRPGFARTSPDQSSNPPERADFIGERDTIATSDSLPVAGAPELPSQAGREPRRPGEIETTESRAQQGSLDHNKLAQNETSLSTAPPTPSRTPATDPPAEKTEAGKTMTTDSVQPTAATADEAPKTMERKDSATVPGNQLVERTSTPQIDPKPQAADSSSRDMAEKTVTEKAELPKPTPPAKSDDPGFRGNQTKTKLSGSITRQGRSALNVANTPMGRYHSALSRAVEAEWHKSCTKYRDFITPGILTVRFVIAQDSSVRTISVVEMIDAGEVQKGFTLNAIRQAKIPPIPADLRAEIEDEPIELTYNFYF
jgi:hypothetical protein